MPSPYNGFLNINKPLRLTSHDVVARIRRGAREQGMGVKVGHAGTLDPLAEGVLVVCMGAATRLSNYMMRGRKRYRASLRLGVETTTYDAEGEITVCKDASAITPDRIRAALPRFIGEIAQLPPMHSAVKVGGKKLYELARKGETIERQPRTVTIYDIRILAWDSPLLEVEVECSHGAYIRSLAHDLGAALNVGAHLAGLTRTASGNFALKSSLELQALLATDDWSPLILSPYCALHDHPRLTLTADEAAELRHGRQIERMQTVDSQVVFGFDAQNELVAILEPRGERWQPRKVFPSAAQDEA